jgi:hypothetical protein
MIRLRWICPFSASLAEFFGGRAARRRWICPVSESFGRDFQLPDLLDFPCFVAISASFCAVRLTRNVRFALFRRVFAEILGSGMIPERWICPVSESFGRDFTFPNGSEALDLPDRAVGAPLDAPSLDSDRRGRPPR